MKISELRIGNYVLDELGLFVEVDIESLLNNKFKQYSPIPLTQEWLLKFGFDDLGDYGFGIGEFHIRMHSNELYFPISNRKIYIINVHQLQNLYFALTYKELELK